jgi:heme/copper-type cytochrome/quinol oxidase subunit 1
VSPARRTFWAWIAFGVGLVALGFALLGFAYANRSYAEPRSTAGWTNYVPLESSSIFSGGGPCYDYADPAPWYVAGGASILVAAVPFALAARRR